MRLGLSTLAFLLAGSFHAASAQGLEGPDTKTTERKSATLTVSTIDASGVGTTLGVIQLEDTVEGLRITPSLSGLPPGKHGFHIHENPDCGPGLDKGKQAAGMAAGSHLDPSHTEKHLGPESPHGHLGDLPALTVADDGTAQTVVIAPRLTVAHVQGHSVMIHAGGDNYSDDPPMGGGGARIACGVFE